MGGTDFGCVQVCFGLGRDGIGDAILGFGEGGSLGVRVVGMGLWTRVVALGHGGLGLGI